MPFLFGFTFALLGGCMIFVPKNIWLFTQSWRYTPDKEPSKVWLLVVRLVGVPLLAMGIGGMVLSFL